MARIRTIKPEFWADEKLAPLDPLTRLVFLGLISQADDAGRLLDNVKLLDGLLFSETDDTCREALDTLARLSRVIRYTSESGQKIIQITKWDEHQRVDRPGKNVLPPPPAEVVTRTMVDNHSQEPREEVATPSRNTRAPTLDLGPRTMEGDQQKNADANASGAAAPQTFPHSHNEEPSPGRLMALIRDGDPETETLGLYGHSRKPPHSRTEGQDFDTITTLVGKGVKPSQIEAWVIGAAMMRDAGLLAEWCKPGESMSLGAMYLNKDGIRPFALTAEAYYHQQLERGAARTNGGMARLKVEVG